MTISKLVNLLSIEGKSHHKQHIVNVCICKVWD